MRGSLPAMVKMLVLVAVCAMLAGCTTASLRLPGGASLLQPKNVTLKGLHYVAPDGSCLDVAEYTSSADVAAIQAQAALVQNVVGTAIQTALKAAVPVAATAATPASAIGVLANDGTSLLAVETTRIVPAAGK